MLKKIALIALAGTLFAACSASNTPNSSTSNGTSDNTTANDTTSSSPSPYASSSPSDLLSPALSPSPSASASQGLSLNGTQAIALTAQSNSGQTGAMTIKEVSGKVQVTLNVTGEPNGVSEPAHIHAGSCPNPGAIVYPLSNVVNGKSVTTLNVSLKTLQSKGALAVNVHKSASDLGTYVACGNIQ